jgi:hypothetical protein
VGVSRKILNLKGPEISQSPRSALPDNDGRHCGGTRVNAAPPPNWNGRSMKKLPKEVLRAFAQMGMGDQGARARDNGTA